MFKFKLRYGLLNAMNKEKREKRQNCPKAFVIISLFFVKEETIRRPSREN